LDSLPPAGFVFTLGEDGYHEVNELQVKYQDALKHDDGKPALSAAGAADFLQKLGKTRTATQRKQELADVDANGDGRCSFIEFLLLHYKVMILQEFFKRKGTEADVDLGNEGIGLIGVGDRLVEEIYAPPPGLDPELDKMMQTFALEQQTRAETLKKLEEQVAEGGVKGMGAKTQLEKLQHEDSAHLNALEARIAAAIKKSTKKALEQMAAHEANKAARQAQLDAEKKSGLAGRVGKFEG